MTALRNERATMRPVKAIHPRVSYADLERAPEDGRRYELYDGEVFVVPSPLPKHQVVALRIAGMLSRFADDHGGFCVASPIDIVFSDYDVLQPDVIYSRPPVRISSTSIASSVTRPICASRCCRRRRPPPIAGRRCSCSRATACLSPGSSIRRRRQFKSTSSAPAATNFVRRRQVRTSSSRLHSRRTPLPRDPSFRSADRQV
jgi:hypothetical protein